MRNNSRLTLGETHKTFARKTNARVWELLRKENRSSIEDDELLYAAFASCYHWLQVGIAVHRQRGEYLLAKVYISLNVAAQALHHATKCLAMTEQHPAEMQDFDLAFAYEGLARAYAMNEKHAAAREYYELAQEAGSRIKDAEDKEIFDADFSGGNWFSFAIER